MKKEELATLKRLFAAAMADLEPESHAVSEYNRFVEQLIEGGLSEPIPNDLLLEAMLLSPRYEEWLEDDYFYRKPPFTIRSVIRDASSVCEVLVLGTQKRDGKNLSTVKVLKKLKGFFGCPKEVQQYHPWNRVAKWFDDGDRAIIFVGAHDLCMGYTDYMPILEVENREYAVSYANRWFWPPEIPVLVQDVPVEAGGRRGTMARPEDSGGRILVELSVLYSLF